MTRDWQLFNLFCGAGSNVMANKRAELKYTDHLKGFEEQLKAAVDEKDELKRALQAEVNERKKKDAEWSRQMKAADRKNATLQSSISSITSRMSLC